jgi:hypothetical protein
VNETEKKPSKEASFSNSRSEKAETTPPSTPDCAKVHDAQEKAREDQDPVEQKRPIAAED